jgi:Transposase DDE domain/SWIM zinc finger
MDLRQQRGMEMAAMLPIQRTKKGMWVVPSQTGQGQYRVILSGEKPTCSCPDFELRGLKCKHQFAVEFVIKREQNADGTVTETRSLTVTQRKTYPQNWRAYNEAQTNEQDKFQALLHDLCKGLQNPAPKNGRPPLPIPDAVFSAVFKVYSTVSQRRFISDLREAHQRGHISKVPHFNSISNALENPALMPIFRELIVESSLPLKSVETNFAVDSSGFTTSRFIRWFDVKYGKPRAEHHWVKCHLMCGTKTNVVTAIEIGEPYANDSPYLPEMVNSTARNFKIGEVSADAAYATKNCAEAIARVGGTPFIALRANATGGAGGAYRQMFHYFSYRREDFVSHYHRRSNVESTFSMIKRKFGDSLRSKSDVAMINETLCKIICHNIVVLIHEMHELGIEPNFWNVEKNSLCAEIEDAQKPLL